MRLSCAVIRVLPQNDDFDLIEFGGFECVEHVGGGRVNNPAGFAFLPHALDDVAEIGLLFFRAECFVPSLHDVS